MYKFPRDLHTLDMALFIRRQCRIRRGPSATECSLKSPPSSGSLFISPVFAAASFFWR